MTRPLALFSEELLDSAHSAMRLSVPLPLASSAAMELRKYSVPPRSSAYPPAGEVAGHTVKPGLPPTAPMVSIWVTETVAAPEASARLDRA